MNRRLVPLAFTAWLFAACEQPVEDPQRSATPGAAALQIAHSSIIVDTHIDVPYRLQRKPADISVAAAKGDFDYPRARRGGLNAAFMSIYTPAELEASNGSHALAVELIDLVYDIVASAPDKFAIALTPDDVRAHFAAGLISLPMGMENGSPLEQDLDNLSYFFDRGIRYVTLAHSLANHLADSSYDDDKRWQGLSEFGVAAVREMNRLGIMVDVSHLSDDAFWQVLDISAVPVIASHSSARYFTPDWERNMDDKMIAALAAKGGVIQINFGSSFVTAAAQQYGSAMWDEREVFLAEHPDLEATEADERFEALYEAEHGPFPYASLDDVLDHIDHVVKLAGIAHVGIGSDYDGVGDTLPVGLKDVSSYPNLIDGLLRRGYSEADIRKILGENLLRVWDEVTAHAAAAAKSSYGAKK